VLYLLLASGESPSTTTVALRAVYTAAISACFGLMAYGLSRLAGLAVRLANRREDLAAVAAVRERLRLARDTHDLLGLGLSTVALKSDLIAALIGRDDARDDSGERRHVPAEVRPRSRSRNRADASGHPLGLRHRPRDGDGGRSGSPLRLLGGHRRLDRHRAPGTGTCGRARLAEPPRLRHHRAPVRRHERAQLLRPPPRAPRAAVVLRHQQADLHHHRRDAVGTTQTGTGCQS